MPCHDVGLSGWGHFLAEGSCETRWTGEGQGAHAVHEPKARQIFKATRLSKDQCQALILFGLGEAKQRQRVTCWSCIDAKADACHFSCTGTNSAFIVDNS